MTKKLTKTDPKDTAAAKPHAPEPVKETMPSAGPHAEPRLTNPDATPGSGTLPPIGCDDDPNMQSTG